MTNETPETITPEVESTEARANGALIPPAILRIAGPSLGRMSAVEPQEAERQEFLARVRGVGR